MSTTERPDEVTPADASPAPSGVAPPEELEGGDRVPNTARDGHAGEDGEVVAIRVVEIADADADMLDDADDADTDADMPDDADDADADVLDGPADADADTFDDAPDEDAGGEPPADDDEALAPAEDEELAAPEAMAQLLFVDVVLLLPSTHPVVVLQEADPPYRELRIPVGGAEGIAIGYAARGLQTPRPLTHELMTNVLEAFGLTLEMVKITSVRGAAFRAEMVVSGRSGVEHLDCRPSDAIALALRQRLPVPIMAAPEVLESAGGDPAGAN